MHKLFKCEQNTVASTDGNKRRLDWRWPMTCSCSLCGPWSAVTAHSPIQKHWTERTWCEDWGWYLQHFSDTTGSSARCVYKRSLSNWDSLLFSSSLYLCTMCSLYHTSLTLTLPLTTRATEVHLFSLFLKLKRIIPRNRTSVFLIPETGPQLEGPQEEGSRLHSSFHLQSPIEDVWLSAAGLWCQPHAAPS